MSFRRIMSTTCKAVDWNQRADFFRFTRGRFVCDENTQMSLRYVEFNMNELCRVAGESIGRECVDVEKFADGMYNKAFLLTMDDDQQIVAKVPNPNAGMPHLTTASEVATMDFMRNKLDVPAPQVIAWSSSSDNPVEAEYIIMEKAKGVPLSSMWPTLDAGNEVQASRSIARYQRTWVQTSFNQIGSLYYRQDLDRTTHNYANTGIAEEDNVSRFVVGPILGRDWLDHGRSELQVDRGPWPSITAFKKAEIERDLQAVRSARSLPKPLSMLCGPGLYQPSRDGKLRAGAAALQAFPHVLPNESLSPPSFTIWHDDLHLENIFVQEDDPSEITAIIDWQSTSITPLFDHTITPGFLDYDGPAVDGMERPTPPDLPESAADAEQSAAWILHEAQTLVSGYKHLLKKAIEPAFAALMYQESDAYHVINASRSLLDNSAAYCLGAVTALDDSPVKFSEAELVEIQQGVEATHASIQAMDKITQAMGDLFPEKGLVRHEDYNHCKAALQRIKRQVVEDFSRSDEDRRAWEEAWPFDD